MTYLCTIYIIIKAQLGQTDYTHPI